MKKIFKLFTSITLLCSILVLFTACISSNNSTDNNTYALSILITNASNREAPNLGDPFIHDSILKAIKSEGYINVINNDGNPEFVLEGSFKLDDSAKGASKNKLNSDAKAQASLIQSELYNVTANDPEIDTLKSLIKAANSLSKQNNCIKTIIVFDTGLSTIGEMDFNNNLISGDPELIADYLEERACIPDLKNITVVWYRINTTEPQKTSEKQYAQIQTIWEAIVKRGGGKMEWHSDCSIPRDGNISSSLPSVSIVNFPESAPIKFDVSTIEESTTSPFVEAQFLSDEQVTFIPDSSEYLYPENAINTLKPIAKYLCDNPDISLLLAGTIAGDSCSDAGIKLSLDRANAVRDSLVSLGVSNDQLITIGLGCSDPWHVYGAGFEGVAASQNRKVVLIDKNADLSKEILSNYH